MVLLIKIDEKPFFISSLGFSPYWDYKPTNAFHSDSPGKYTSDELLNLSTINKIHLKCDGIDGSIVDGIQEPILFSFILDTPLVYKIFGEPETIHFKKTNLFGII